MASVNKVVYGDRTLIDLSDISVTPETLLKGVTAYDASGTLITGTYETDTSMIETIYPIGAIYISTAGTNPSELFGFGTWEQISDTFLLAAGSTYNAGSTGGEASHMLTANEMPSHKHTVTLESAGAHTHKIGTDKDVDYLAGGDCWSVHSNATGASYMNGATSSAGSHTHTVTVGNTGGNSAHNNMPPYLAVYMWKRTA